MAIDQALRDLMQDTVTIEPFASVNVNQEDSYGASVSYTCRVVGKRKIIRKLDGQEAVSMAQVYLDRLATVDPRDRITLPSRFAMRTPAILSVEMLPDEDGTSGSGAHSVVYL